MTREEVAEFLGLGTGKSTDHSKSVTGEPYREFNCQTRIDAGGQFNVVYLDEKMRQLLKDYLDHVRWFGRGLEAPKIYWRFGPESREWTHGESRWAGIYARLLISKKPVLSSIKPDVSRETEHAPT